AITTVLVLSVVTASLQIATRTPSAILGEPPAFTILPDGDDVARLSPVTVTFAKSPEERTLDQLFQVVPAVSGSYAWLTPRTALCPAHRAGRPIRAAAARDRRVAQHVDLPLPPDRPHTRDEIPPEDREGTHVGGRRRPAAGLRCELHDDHARGRSRPARHELDL